MRLKLVSSLFWFAAFYDGVLGASFLFFGSSIFAMFGVPPPNHFGYIAFPALLLILFAIMFARVAHRPVERRELIIYGCGLKAAYSGVVFWYALHGGVPFMWIPFAWADVAFFVVFVVAWTATASD